MWKKSAWSMALVILTAAEVGAQDPRVEVGATAGWMYTTA